MSKREDLIAQYADDLQKKCSLKPDMKLLTAVTIGCGPTIYNADACTVASGDAKEMDRIKKNFLIKKLGLADTPKLDEGLKAVTEQYGRANRKKYRAVFYYLLVKHFRKGSVYA